MFLQLPQSASLSRPLVEVSLQRFARYAATQNRLSMDSASELALLRCVTHALLFIGAIGLPRDVDLKSASSFSERLTSVAACSPHDLPQRSALGATHENRVQHETGFVCTHRPTGDQAATWAYFVAPRRLQPLRGAGSTAVTHATSWNRHSSCLHCHRSTMDDSGDEDHGPTMILLKRQCVVSLHRYHAKNRRQRDDHFGAARAVIKGNTSWTTNCTCNPQDGVNHTNDTDTAGGNEESARERKHDNWCTRSSPTTPPHPTPPHPTPPCWMTWNARAPFQCDTT